MKLSIVIPAYNEALYLPACLEAILKQKNDIHGPVEVIVVNNASTDHTRQVAASFPDILVIDEPRKGLTFARQAGLRAATGDLIANVDADSILTPGWLRFVAQTFSEHPDLIALSGPLIYYDLPLLSNLFVRFYYGIGFASYLVNRFVLRVSSFLQGGNFIVKKSALERIGGFNTDIAFYGEDTDIARRLHALGPVRFTFKLNMYSSGRRLKSEGLLAMGLKYPINYFWTIFFKRPFHKNYTDVRANAARDFRFRTTAARLSKTLTILNISAAALLFIVLGGGVYTYAAITKLTQPQIAQASQASYFVRKVSPIVLKTQRTIRAIRYETDDR